MADKRMFSNKVIGTDSFLEMPDSTQNLYFHFSMNADDDGFVDNFKSIMRMTGKKEDDLKILIAKQFLIPFESGVLVIRHWRVNNYLRSDRYKETQYTKEKSQLSVKENGEYTNGIPSGIPSIDKNRLDKISIDKSSNQQVGGTHRFSKPTLIEVKEYCLERKNDINPQRFIDFYESKGWKVGKTPMKDWKASVRTWEQRNTTQKVVNDYDW